MKRNTIIRLLMLILMTFVISGCSKATSNGSIDIDAYEPQTYTKEYYFKSTDKMEKLTFKFDIALDYWEFKWKLYDPNGKVENSNELSGFRNYNEVFYYQPIEGKWKLVITLEDVIGTIDINYLGD